MPGKYRKLDTPTSGKAEVRAAMLKANAHSGRSRTTQAIARNVGPGVTAASVQTVLTQLVIDGHVTSSSGSHTLTTAGLTQARLHPHPRYTSV